MQRERVTVAVILALLWGVVVATAYHLVEGGSWQRILIVSIPIGLIFMTPAYYLGHADRRVKKCSAWASRIFRR